MTLKLVFIPQTRSTRPRWVLEELGIEHELLRLQAPSDLANPHPLKQVPVLIDDGQIIIESSAICMYLAEKYPEGKLAPALGSSDRGAYLQWIFFAMTTLEPIVAEYFYNAVASFIPAADKHPERAAKAKVKMPQVIAPLVNHLSHHPYLAGDFSVADIIMASVIGWAKAIKFIDDPVLLEYNRRCTARPAFAKAMA